MLKALGIQDWQLSDKRPRLNGVMRQQNLSEQQTDQCCALVACAQQHVYEIACQQHECHTLRSQNGGSNDSCCH